MVTELGQFMDMMPHMLRRAARFVSTISFRSAPDRLERQGEQQQHGKQTTHAVQFIRADRMPEDPRASCRIPLAASGAYTLLPTWKAPAIMGLRTLPEFRMPALSILKIARRAHWALLVKLSTWRLTLFLRWQESSVGRAGLVRPLASGNRFARAR